MKAISTSGVIFCDNHSTNASAYKKLFGRFGPEDENQLFKTFNDQKICTFFDTIYLIINIWNNMLNRKRFTFS